MRRNPRLSARLFFSYLVLVVVLLLVMTAAFVLFLFAQPVPPAPTYERLLTTMQSIVPQVGLSARPTLGELTRMMNQLPQLAAENDVRILVVNIPNQTVTFDSAGQFSRGDTTRMNEESFTIPTPRLISGQAVFGQFADKDGTRWLFAGIATVRQGQEANAIILADLRRSKPLPTLSTASAANWRCRWHKLRWSGWWWRRFWRRSSAVP